MLNENLKDERSKHNAADFLTAETEMLSKELAELDQKIADFKQQNEGALPGQNQFNIGIVTLSHRLTTKISS